MKKNIGISEIFLESWYNSLKVVYDWSPKRSHRLLNYYLQYCSNLGIKNSKILDIGGGSGLLSFICSELGANVTCVDPISDGSNLHMINLRKILMTGSIDKQIKFITSKFQDYPEHQEFDFIFLHNSINHLNELACLNLIKQKWANEEYVKIFQKISRMLNDGGYVIVSDCSARNLFGDLGIKNPVGRTINWSLHHQPEIWIELAKSGNLNFHSLKWSSLQIFGSVGKKFMRNKFFAYLTSSHFTIYLKK